MSSDEKSGSQRAIKRPRVPPGPLADLKALIYGLYLEAGTPRLAQIEEWLARIPRDASPGRDTVARIIGGATMPPSYADLAIVVTVLARAALWDPDDAVRRARDLWVAAKMAVPAGVPQAEVTDPFTLEVHRPVDVAVRPGSAALPTLPVYVAREHDRRLAEIVSQAAAGNSSIAVLVGGSSTGKTRACWEAVHALPAGWRLWHPLFPNRAEAFLAELERVGPRTVVWLNDVQFYLATGDSLAGERVAAGLRHLLRDQQRGPVLVLGTVWPQYWQALTGPPAPDGRDLHAQARELLVGTAIEVPEFFTGPALAALAVAARDDPRLAAAQQAGDGQVTQFLAGVPALLERYRTAPPVARAVIDAALHARALGHGPALPHALLEAAAPGYLTDQQWEEDAGEDWLEQALAYTAAPCRGVRGPLTRIRPRPGHPVPSQPHYRPADYLEQTGLAGQAGSVPASLWDALLAHARREDLPQFAVRAQMRSLYRYAFHLYVAAADAGDTAAPEAAARMLREAGRTEEAITWLRSRADAGDARGLGAAARMLEWKTGRTEEAITFYQQAAEAGDTHVLGRAAWMLRRAGRTEEAITFYQRAAEAGDADALGSAAGMLEDAGRTEEAITWLRSRADAGDTGAPWAAARVLRDAGRTEEAITWLRSRADAGDTEALGVAASILEGAGRTEEAITWLLSRADAGDTHVLGRAAGMLRRAGRTEEAITFYQRAAEAGGDPRTLMRVAAMLGNAGRTEEAITFYQRAAEGGDTEALDAAALMLRRAGQTELAITFYQRAAEAGYPVALKTAARMLREAGRTEEAITWLLSRADAHVPGALGAAARMLREAGRTEEAITWLRSRADAGHTAALGAAARMLEDAGRTEEAITFNQQAAEAGDPYALGWAARMLEDAGRTEEAIAFYQRAAEAGHTDALGRAVLLLRDVGRTEEAARLHRYGIEPGGRTADLWEPGA